MWVFVVVGSQNLLLRKCCLYYQIPFVCLSFYRFYSKTITITNIYGYSSNPHIETVTIGDPILPGDVNFDEVVNILDVVLIVNFVLGSETPTNSQYNAGDYNDDGYLNIQDIVMLINAILD